MVWSPYKFRGCFDDHAWHGCEYRSKHDRSIVGRFNNSWFILCMREQHFAFLIFALCDPVVICLSFFFLDSQKKKIQMLIFSFLFFFVRLTGFHHQQLCLRPVGSVDCVHGQLAFVLGVVGGTAFVGGGRRCATNIDDFGRKKHWQSAQCFGGNCEWKREIGERNSSVWVAIRGESPLVLVLRQRLCITWRSTTYTTSRIVGCFQNKILSY